MASYTSIAHASTDTKVSLWGLVGDDLKISGTGTGTSISHSEWSEWMRVPHSRRRLAGRIDHVKKKISFGWVYDDEAMGYAKRLMAIDFPGYKLINTNNDDGW